MRLIWLLIEAKKLSGGLARQGFEAKKYYPERSVGVEIFLSKPEGLDLFCRRGLTLPQQKPK
ncbi:hypothetical protein BCY91_06765 [Pelobium manganitolerans]|uniref:Uncharacterized protein n=1 Tax=Pelobium manganitolerans TaxID=1842495 RepID=A0A419S511_9SPHI|nr:hypothetical protein BCY91_06765 [Pelobium manganitolerans]